ARSGARLRARADRLAPVAPRGVRGAGARSGRRVARFCHAARRASSLPLSSERERRPAACRWARVNLRFLSVCTVETVRRGALCGAA
uniref:Uncharacterized protein n=2 Tax=Emiliania huxleyi TaxID=2903 RepID=A0A0D3JVZ5_EMIH1